MGCKRPRQPSHDVMPRMSGGCPPISLLYERMCAIVHGDEHHRCARAARTVVGDRRRHITAGGAGRRPHSDGCAGRRDGGDARDIDALEAQFSRWLLLFDRARGFETEGSNSAVSWLRGVCRLSGGAAAERVQVARELAQLPDTKASFDSGEIGYQHAAVIARSAAELGVDVG